jgi:plastocyanin
MMGGYGDGWWILMWAWMAVFWLLVFAGVAWLIWRAQEPRHDASAADEILKQRLVRGEIDVEQYRALAQELRPAGRASPGGGQILLTVVAALAFMTLLSLPAIAATRGDWDMFDHMGRMMGGGRNTADAPLTAGGSAETVTIQDFTFSPGNLQVPVGATVTWTNRDSAPHNTTSRDGAWKTDTLSEGESGAVTFDRAGEYDYDCSIHPSMKAHLSVK